MTCPSVRRESIGSRNGEPDLPLQHALLAQSGRAPHYGCEGCEFEPRGGFYRARAVATSTGLRPASAMRLPQPGQRSCP